MSANTLASVFAAVFFIAASYAGCDQTLVVLFFTLSVGSQALTIPGTYVNPLDLSPNYVGPLTALVNGAGSITGILAPYVIGLLTPNVSHHCDCAHARICAHFRGAQYS